MTDCDIRLFLEIVNTSRNKLMEKFPNVEFHIILWDKKPDDDTYIGIRKGLKIVTNNIHLISNILPNFYELVEEYEISKHDRHPNALAHKLIAEYVVNNILDKNIASKFE